MNAELPIRRGRFQGVGEIFAFNWHWYAIGFAGLIVTGAALMIFQWPAWFRVIAFCGICGAACWSVASLAVSHWVYDRSPLRDWKWIANALSLAPRRWVNIHCGLDESSTSLRRIFDESIGKVLDIFDSAEMTEPSITRARVAHVGAYSPPADFRQLPLAPDSMDAAFLLFAAHELRRAQSRAQLFGEVKRVLRAGGEVVVAEHLRDAANFAAFGPGAFHFFSRGEWLRVFARAGLQLRREFSVTPFVRVFVLRRSA